MGVRPAGEACSSASLRSSAHLCTSSWASSKAWRTARAVGGTSEWVPRSQGLGCEMAGAEGVLMIGILYLHGCDGEQGEVVNEADLLLDDRLAVGHAGQHPVVAGLGEGALANLLLGNKQA